MWWMPSGSLTTNSRRQAKRRSTNNSSNNSSSQAATALSGKVRSNCQLDSGRAGRGGNASAGCGSAMAIIGGAARSTGIGGRRLARLDGHLDAASRMEIGPGQGLDALPGPEVKAEGLGDGG